MELESTTRLPMPRLLRARCSPEAVAAGLVAGVDRGVRRQPEAGLGLGNFLGQPVEVAGRHRAEARLLGGRRGARQQPLVLAQLQGDVQGLRGGHGSASVIRLRMSCRTETCTTSDTLPTTWYRTTKFSSGAGWKELMPCQAVMPAPSAATAGS